MPDQANYSNSPKFNTSENLYLNQSLNSKATERQKLVLYK